MPLSAVPDTMSDVPSLRAPELIGRDAELEELVSLLGVRAPVETPSALALLLSGDAGVGKTRLLTELRDVAATEGWRVVAGHCLDLAESGLPFLPFTEILGRLADEDPATVAAVTEQHPALARLQPGRRLRSPDEPDPDPATPLDRAGVVAAVRDLIDAAARSMPLLVVIEDAHWADESTRDLLSLLFSQPGAAPVRIVVSYRSDDLHRRHPLRRHLAEWGRLRGVQRLALEPLDDPATRRLIKALRPGTLAEADFTSILDRADGNPFFVEELVGASWGGPLPAELADVLLLRLDGLDESALRVVRLASVAGRRVSHALLSAVSDLDGDRLEAALRQAVESNVLVAGRDASFQFRHALLAEAVYDDLLPGERARLHRAFTDALTEQALGTSAELAQHARRAGEPAIALAASVDAAREAMAVGGAAEAAAHYLEALNLMGSVATLPDGIDETTLVRSTAEAFMASGRVARAIKVLRTHLAWIGPDAPAQDRGQLLTAVADALLHIDADESPRAVAEEAVALLRDGPAPLLAAALSVQARAIGSWHPEELRATAGEAMELADRHGLTGIKVDLETTLAGLDAAGGGSGDAWRDAAESARAAGLIDAELRAMYLHARRLHDRGDPAAAESYRALIRRAEENGRPWSPYPGEARPMLAMLMIRDGDPDAAWRLMDVTGQEPPAVFEWLYFALQMFIRFGIRAHGECHAVFEHLREHWHRDGQIALLGGSAELLRAEAAADPATASRVYAEMVAALGPVWGEWFQARLRLSTYVVAAHAAAAPTRTVEEREADAESVARLMGDGQLVIEGIAQYPPGHGPEYHAWVARRSAEHLRWRWLAQIGPPSADELVEGWREAERAFVEYGEVFELARTRVRLAAALRAAGDRAGAREASDLAREAAQSVGARPVLDELAADGPASPPDREPRSELALTPRESEILALVEQGRSNGEIGRQLFIATKTVSVHVSNILGKLGASSRTEAAALARRRGLL